jgi:hypothetical protein
MISDIPGDLGGGNPLVPWLNRLKRAIKKRTLLSGLGYKVKYSESGTVLEILPGSGGRPSPISPIKRFRLIALRGDYSLCRTWDGINLGSDYVFVARPPKLRRSISAETIGGNVISYTYSGPTSRIAAFSTFSENQIVIPWHLGLDEIYAAKPDGGTGVVTVAPETVDEPVEWIDLNVDGRAWALAFQ